MGSPRLLFFAAVFLCLAAAHMAWISLDLRLATADDEALIASVANRETSDNNLLMDYSIGRFYAVGKFWFLGALQVHSANSPWRLVFARTLFLLLPVAAAGWLSAILLKSAEGGALIAVLWMATYSFYVGYQPLFSNPLLLLGLTLALLSCGTALRAHNSPRAARWQAGSVSLFALALLTHEVFVVFIVALLWCRLATASSTKSRPSLTAFTTPYLAVIVAYVGLYFLLRHQAATLMIPYDGASLSIRPLPALTALRNYSVAALPGFEVFFDRTAGAHQLPCYSVGEVLHRIALNLRWDDAGISVFAGSIAALLAFRLGQLPRPHLGLAAIAVALGLVFLPNLLIACTPKYQVWAHQRRLPYYYSGLGLPFFWWVAILGLWRYFESLKKRKTLRLLVGAAAFGLVVTAGTASISAVNREAVHRMTTQPFR